MSPYVSSNWLVLQTKWRKWNKSLCLYPRNKLKKNKKLWGTCKKPQTKTNASLCVLFSFIFFLAADQNIRLYDTSRGRFHLWRTVKARDVGWSVLDVCFTPDAHHVLYSSWSDYSKAMGPVKYYMMKWGKQFAIIRKTNSIKIQQTYKSSRLALFFFFF